MGGVSVIETDIEEAVIVVGLVLVAVTVLVAVIAVAVEREVEMAALSDVLPALGLVVEIEMVALAVAEVEVDVEMELDKIAEQLSAIGNDLFKTELKADFIWNLPPKIFSKDFSSKILWATEGSFSGIIISPISSQIR